jgi:PTH1 family peptidyl-tRNA hydrolase
MFYIVALGNPGEKYARTRHNVGWMAIDVALQAWNLPSLIAESKYSGRTTMGGLKNQPIRVLYPDTYMNNSGTAVKKFVATHDVENLIVVHDDIDLPFGEVRVNYGRGAGGNNGVDSIIKKLGTKNFVRVRIGIAPTSIWTGRVKRPRGGGPLERYVLKEFSKKEQQQLPKVLETVRDVIETVLESGVEVAMNQYNEGQAKK